MLLRKLPTATKLNYSLSTRNFPDLPSNPSSHSGQFCFFFCGIFLYKNLFHQIWSVSQAYILGYKSLRTIYPFHSPAKTKLLYKSTFNLVHYYMSSSTTMSPTLLPRLVHHKIACTLAATSTTLLFGGKVAHSYM